MPSDKQQKEAFTGFTLVRQVTDYDPAGNTYPSHMETHYVSSGGDWRYVATYPNGQVIETIYRRGKGIFFADHKNRRLQKFGDGGSPAPTTAERLQADPKFVRTEYVLGQLAYLHRQDIGFVEETYFVPELGPFPFKRINHLTSFKRVEEPVSLTFGEPERAHFHGADYPLIEQTPTYDANLSRRLQEKPEPHYPPEAIADGILGEVVLQVIVDESGWVIRAAVVSSPPLLAEAAMEAASRARFAPSKREGSPVTLTGVIIYRFAPRPSSNMRMKLIP